MSRSLTDKSHWLDARAMFFTERHGNPGTRLPGVPWPVLRSQPPDRSTALTHSADKPSLWRFETAADDIRQGNGYSTHNEFQTAFSYNDPARSQTFAHDGTAVFGADYWVSYAVMFEPGPVSHNQWFIVGQWHATEDGPITAPSRAPDDAVSPPLAVDLMDGDVLTVTSRTDPKPRTLISAFPEERIEWSSGAPIARGRWYRLVMHVRWGWAGDGKLEVWVNGAKTVSRLDHYSIGYNDVVGPHWNWGAYRGWYRDGRANDPNPLAVQIANMEVSQASLLDRVAHPPAE